MYSNVRAEMARKNIKIVDLAEMTGIRYQTLSDKLRGDAPILMKEAVAIKNALQVDMPLEELFAVEQVAQ